MRHATEAARSDGRIVIIEDDKTGSCSIAHSARGDSVGGNGKSSKIILTHRHPMPCGKNIPRNDGGSSKVFSARSSAWWRGACSSAHVMMAAVLIAVTLDAAQSGTININMIGEQPVGRAELDGPYAKIVPRVEARTGQTSTSEQAPRAQQVAATAVPVAQQFQKDDRVQALAQELTEARRTIEGLEAQLRAEAAKSAQLVEEERQKSVALAKEAAAARQELTTATAKHRQALAEEREGRASLLATAAVRRNAKRWTRSAHSATRWQVNSPRRSVRSRHRRCKCGS